MAKLCIYCGRPLAKDDARFCNDCGQPQTVPTNASVSVAAPSAIKVKLPPKEYIREEEATAASQGSSEPGSELRATPVAPASREQAAPLASRFPKRPTRLATPTSVAAEAKNQAMTEPVSPPVRQGKAELASPVARQEKVEPAPETKPTPAEEVSTMVLPNWREELAQLRKEQEQARADATVVAEKKPARPSTEPPPLPRRSSSLNPASDKKDARISSQAPARPAMGGRLAPLPETPLPKESVRPLDAPPKAPDTPLPPRESARSAESTPQKTPASSEQARPLDSVRRELHVKVWEQETIARPSVSAENRGEAGPAPAVDLNPLAEIDFELEKDEDLAGVAWQRPLTPLPSEAKSAPVREEKRDKPELEKRLAREEKFPVVETQPRREERLSSPDKKQAVVDLPDSDKTQLVREEKASSEKEADLALSRGAAPLSGDQKKDKERARQGEPDIEDLPTARLAVPEQAKKPEPSIKIERASTPAPKKWSSQQTEDVEDLPTRPMPASPGGVSSVSAQQSSTAPGGAPPVRPGNSAPAQGSGSHAEAGPMKSAPPQAQRGIAPASLPGIPDGPSPAARPIDAQPGPNAPRVQAAGTPGQTTPRFDPASLPPLPSPSGPPSAQGGRRARPDGSGAPVQNSPSSEAYLASKSVSANTAISEGTRASATKKTARRKLSGRTIGVFALIIVLIGVGMGAFLNWDWVTQFFQTPVQNQPYRTYQNTSMGFAVEYTQGWHIDIDQAHSALLFADSSRTGQAYVTVSAGNGPVSDYLSQQETHLGITSPKAVAPTTMGGVSWQGVQGSVTQSGATYTAILYVTQHDGHFYTLEFLAPQVSFNAVKLSSFDHMQATWRFV